MFSVYNDPIVIKKFITTEYCDKIINMSKHDLKTSLVNVNDILDPTIRKSENTNLTCEHVNKHIVNKCSSILRQDKFTFEPLHVVKYERGGFYRPHYDSSIYHVRPYTFIITLNDNYKGGETHFPNLNKTYKLEKGDALFFHNYTTDHLETTLSFHGGKEVLCGEKWIANLWINSR